ncbi:MAG TPA: MarR family transcriptional regulator [Hyphomicrobiales bacterium]|nr:MarR family transcriptional regulator [Rhodobiaceae bacterium]HXK53187.1 MarR family transcriptional regulator [Hyphomicrobiales bacterium]
MTPRRQGPAPAGYEPSQGEEFSIDDRVGHLLRRAYQRASAHLAVRLRALSLTPVQFAVLMRLHERGQLSQNQLGRLVSMPPGNIHGLVGRLAKRGLIVTDNDPNDRRLVLISLSPEGAGLTDELIKLDLEATKDALSPLEPHEQEIFLKLLKRMA